MPNYIVHSIGSLIIVYGLLYVVHFFFSFAIDWLLWLLCFPLIVLYGLLPDIDIGTSKIRTWMMPIVLVMCLFFVVFDYMWATIGLLLLLLFIHLLRHRGFSHTWLGSVVFCIPLLFFGIEFFLVGWMSYAVHLVLDRL
ncbi:MAG: hypothetical protein ACMXYC_03800 [Candidatus Woesearchaeota archaeon]